MAMAKFGIDNVRGESYTQNTLPNVSIAVKTKKYDENPKEHAFIDILFKVNT